MPDSPFRCVLDVKARLAESPTWAVDEQALWFVDIHGPAIHRYDPATGAHDVVPAHASAGCLGLRDADRVGQVGTRNLGVDHPVGVRL